MGNVGAIHNSAAIYNRGADNELVSEVRGSGSSSTSPIASASTKVSKFYHTDGHGSTGAITDASGTTTDTLTTDAFGLTATGSGSTPTPFGYAAQSGYRTDADTRLMLLGHRYYDPSTGRFLSRDSVLDGYNWYPYCNNDPVNYGDPTGLDDSKPPWEQGYETVDQAAKAVLMYIYTKSNDEGFEYGGTIKDGGRISRKIATAQVRHTLIGMQLK